MSCRKPVSTWLCDWRLFAPTIHPSMPAMMAAVTTIVTMFIGCCHHGRTRSASPLVAVGFVAVAVVVAGAAVCPLGSATVELDQLVERQLG